MDDESKRILKSVFLGLIGQATLNGDPIGGIKIDFEGKNPIIEIITHGEAPSVVIELNTSFELYKDKSSKPVGSRKRPESIMESMAESREQQLLRLIQQDNPWHVNEDLEKELETLREERVEWRQAHNRLS